MKFMPAIKRAADTLMKKERSNERATFCYS